MSPGAPPSLVGLARLRQALADDRAALDRWERELAVAMADWTTSSSRPEMRSHVGVALHAWYSALEDLLERSVRIFEGEVPIGAQSHVELLVQATTEVRELRPAILPRQLETPLRELLKFRHFFRHAYVVELDAAKLETNARVLLGVRAQVSAALSTWDDFLARTEDVLRET